MPDDLGFGFFDEMKNYIRHIISIIILGILFGLLLLWLNDSVCSDANASMLILQPSNLFLQQNNSQVIVSWDANTESDLAGYKVYYGTESRNYIFVIDVGNVTDKILDGFIENITYYFAVTAYDSSDNESNFSEEVSITITSQSNKKPINPVLTLIGNDIDGDTVIVKNDTLIYEIVQMPLYEDGSAFNPDSLRGLSVHLSEARVDNWRKVADYNFNTIPQLLVSVNTVYKTTVTTWIQVESEPAIQKFFKVEGKAFQEKVIRLAIPIKQENTF